MFEFEDLDYYELLGVARSASADEVKRAYRREITKYHPDRVVNGTPDEQRYARLRSQQLNEAYAALNGQAGPRRSARPSSPSAAPAEPAAPRDHQAELYEQARVHLQAGRALQAIGVLRQLQQINPFYRDSAALLEQAEAQVKTRRRGSRRGRPLLLLGAAGGVAVLAFALWNAAGRPPFTDDTGEANSTPAPIAAVASPVPTSAPIAAVASPVPSAMPEPTPEPSAMPEPPPEPTLPATLVVVEPTAEPTPEPTVEPTPKPPPPTPEPPPPPVAEAGTPLFRDEFTSGGWVDLAGNGWTVGFQGERYRVTANLGAGPIWSYRAGAPLNATVGADVQVARGAGGLMLRFVDDSNYLGFTINPAQTSFRLEQVSGGLTNVLAGGQSGAISADPNIYNRIVIRIVNNRYQLFANNQLLAEGNLPPGPVSNRYGLLAVGGDTASVVFFDNLEIRAP